MILIVLLIFLMIFYPVSSILASPIIDDLGEIQYKDGLYCLTEQQIIEIANYIENKKLEIEQLEFKIDELDGRIVAERKAHDKLIKSKNETINLQEVQIQTQQKQIQELTNLVATREDMIDVGNEILQKEREKIKILESQKFTNKLITAGIVTVTGVTIFLLIK